MRNSFSPMRISKGIGIFVFYEHKCFPHRQVFLLVSALDHHAWSISISVWLKRLFAHVRFPGTARVFCWIRGVQYRKGLMLRKRERFQQKSQYRSEFQAVLSAPTQMAPASRSFLNLLEFSADFTETLKPDPNLISFFSCPLLESGTILAAKGGLRTI